MRKVIAPFTSPRFGNCNAGDPIDVSGDLAKQFEDAGIIEKETKQEPKIKLETKPQVEKKQTKAKK